MNPSRGGTTESIEDYEELANLLNTKMHQRLGGSNQRLAQMLGMLTKDGQIKGNIPSKDRSNYSQERYKFFLDAPFEISNMCCDIMKKEPAHKYHTKTGRNPITATMACESQLRRQKWIEHGCNGFDLKIPTSNPMSFWLEQDVLQYIKQNNLPICSVYGEIVKDASKMGGVDGQLEMSDCFGECAKQFDAKEYLTTTGCKRTGCMLCGFGCHLEKESRFLRLKETHPGMYEMLDRCENNGYTFRQALEWINEHGNMNIRF